jgi:predicted MFS family arabinose efflux permease
MPRPTRLALLIAVLSMTQVIGWGTTYYMPAVLAPALARDLGIEPQLIFFGVTIMVGLGALASPAAGRQLDRLGAARLLPLGSALIGTGLALLAAFPDVASFLAAWILFGLAAPLALSLAALTLLIQVAGARSRHAIGILMLFSGLAPGVFWPLASLLEAAVGWRGTVAVFAGINLLLALPAHAALAVVFRLGRSGGWEGAESDGRSVQALITDRRARRRAGWLLVLAFACQGFSSWGLPLHLVSMFEQSGMTNATAVAIAALNGPATIGARLIDLALGGRLQPLTMALLVTALLPLSLLPLLLPIEPATAALAFTLIWSGANGIMSILRTTLPLALLGSAGFGAILGKLSLPQNLAFAVSPFAFALVIEAGGPTIGVVLAMAVSLAALAALAALGREVRRAGRA